ncbi:SDR family NAD(P)-dependent oxidoreductase [Chitinophaga solisilvae]|uniref:SDR family NAD(P)-dependent oxidoreductase n=1 Tax=Chitinophaga solisilvae TaxID=1233460 RepID=UPI00136B2D5A|nr:SDR family NAD(P)-dependent oxidoreductase [Chitinophaga solisilvae]
MTDIFQYILQELKNGRLSKEAAMEMLHAEREKARMAAQSPAADKPTGILLQPLSANGHQEESDVQVTLAALPGNGQPAHAAAVPEETVTDAAAAPLIPLEQLQQELIISLADALYQKAERIDPHKKFIEMGLDSIVGVEWIRAVNRKYSVSLSVTKVYDYPTIHEFAPVLQAEMGKKGKKGNSRAVRPDETTKSPVTAPLKEELPATLPVQDVIPASYGLVMNGVHKLEELQLLPWEKEPPAPDEVRIAVKASAINFPDVMCVKGLYPTIPDYPFVPGFEVSGVIDAVGSAVSGFKQGDEVVAITGRQLGGHAAFVNAPAVNTVRKPVNVSFEEACSLPVVFGTVYAAFETGQLSEGEHVLIQTATGGCGLMAIQLAHLRHCTIYGTAGKTGKLEILQQLQVPHVMNYKTAFDKEILQITNGRGVDVVLNMLSGDGIQKGLNCLAPSGRYLELAVHALKTSPALDLSRLTANQSLHSIDLRRLGFDKGVHGKELLERMVSWVEEGKIVPVVSRVYPLSRIQEALAYVDEGLHIGKVVISHTQQAMTDLTAQCIQRLQEHKAAADKNIFTRHDAPAADQPLTAAYEGIAVIGISGQFPQSADAAAFWQNIAEGKDCITVVPEKRWSVAQYYDPVLSPGKSNSKWMGAVTDADCFDPLFFSISPVEAMVMDPQQRLFLENCWHCIEDAGLDPAGLSGSRCGVFVGVGTGDYGQVMDQQRLNAQGLMGVSTSILSARISYLLNLKGPCLAIDTACSSSLVAIAEACNSLVLGTSDLALAGGVCVLSGPLTHILTSHAGMLSPEGRCFTFDNRADGYVPGEGAGVVLLKRLSDAVRDKDPVYGVIRGWGINQDGKTNGITAPSVNSQIALEKEIYQRFNIDPATISLVEAHGTGTKLGDPIEVEALTASFRAFTDKEYYCALGSVKSNIGHLLTAAGAAGIIKVLKALEQKQLPPSIHFQELNEHIDLDNSPFYVNTSLREWQAVPGVPRRAAVSSFGFSGTNSHLVVEEFVSPYKVSSQATGPFIFVLSAQSMEQLKVYAGRLKTALEAQDTLFPEDVAYTLQTGRTALDCRLALVAGSLAELLDKLQRYIAGIAAEGVFVSCITNAPVKGATADREEEQRMLLQLWIQQKRPDKIAALWTEGSTIIWERLYENSLPRRVHLPGYPFARESYWTENNTEESTVIHTTAVLHPLLHRNTSGFAGIRFSSTFTGSEFFLADHEVKGQHLLPGVAFVEMARAAIAEAATAPEPGMHLRFRHLVWKRPAVAGATPLQLQVQLTAAQQEISFAIGDDGNMTPCFEGHAAWHPGTAATADIAAIQARCNEQQFSGKECYEIFRSLGITYGPSFQGITQLYTGQGQVLAAIKLPDTTGDDASRFVLHPALADAALQASIGLLLQQKEPLKAALPFALETMDIYSACTSHMWVHIRFNSSAVTDSKVQKLDADLYDAAGRLCVRITGFTSRIPEENIPHHPVSSNNEAPLTGTLMMTPVWEAVNIPQTAAITAPATWLLAGGIAEDRHTLQQLFPLAQVLPLHAQNPGNITTGTHLVWIAPDNIPDFNDSAALIAAQEPGVLSFFRLIKTLLQKGYATHELSWTIITRSCVSTGPHDRIRPVHAALHGLCGAMAKEFPHWSVRLADIPEGVPVPWEQILRLPADAAGNALAWREGSWYSQRLALLEQSSPAASLYRRNGVYVVIGGAGGIGTEWTEYMIRNWQAQVIWIGRRREDAAMRIRREQLGALGVMPDYIQADATDAAALRAAHATVVSRYGRIHGVIQSAIVLQDQGLLNMEESAFQAALRAKADISIHLAQVFGNEKPDFVLFFSSMVSYLKNAGQSNYAAGSTFEDAYARYLAQQWNCPVKTMNWGYWGHTGIVSGAAYRQRMHDAGVGSVASPEAMAALEQLLTGPFDSMALMNAIQPLSSPVIRPLEKISVYPLRLASLTSASAAVYHHLEQPGDSMTEQLQQLDRLLCRLLWGQLQSMGIFIEERVSVAALKAGIRLPAAYDRWLDESLSQLEKHGYMQYDGRYCIVQQLRPTDMNAAWQEWEQQKVIWKEDASMQAHLLLAEHTLRALPKVLSGKKSATDVIFPGSSMELVEGIYKENKISGYFDRMLAATIVAYIEERRRKDPAAKIRILEAGAGTGGTSAVLFAHLRPYAASIETYCYTDISRAFLLHAEEHYGPDVPYLTYKVFDVSIPAAEQDIPAGAYDIVIAANVLHATPDVRRTLRNLKTLLPANGRLLLHELSQKALVAHLTFGLLDGWWLYEDEALRIPGSPVLSPEKWVQALQDEGFRQIAFPAATAHHLGHQVVIAESDGIIRRPLILSQEKTTAPVPVPVAEPQPQQPSSGDAVPAARELIKKVLAKALKLAPERIGLHTPFEKYGIDSILQVTLVRELEKTTGALPATLFFEYVTVQELAEYLAVNHAGQLISDTDIQAEVTPPAAPVTVSKTTKAQPVPLPAAGHGPEDIAIIGISGRYPGADNLEVFWEKLKSGANSITAAPAGRWRNNPAASHNGNAHTESGYYGGFLEHTDKFDYQLFGITPDQVHELSPETRLFLEVVWETLEDAGYNTTMLQQLQTAQGAGVGVFAGAMYNQYPWSMPTAALGELSSNATEWHIANRVSHFFQLTGPSLVVNTACSSSLTAIHLACESLRQQNCAMAVAGGVNLTLAVSKYAALQQKNLLGSGQESRSFGVNTGFIPGEGVGAVILKPLSQALKDKDHIRGIIKGSFINHSGGRQLYNAPDPKQEAQLIINSLRRSAIDPVTIGYVEAAANGSSLGDAVEVVALQQAFASFTDKKQYCALGAVKSNIGHLEAASGISQLTKVLLQLEHKLLVPSINANPRNPNIRLEQTAFRLQETCSPWDAVTDPVSGMTLPRRSMINSFGAGGAYASLVIEEYIPSPVTARQERKPAVFLFSAGTPHSLWQYLEAMQTLLHKNNTVAAADIAYSLLRNNHELPYRAAIIASSAEELLAGITGLLQERRSTPFKGIYLQIAPPAAEMPDEVFIPVTATADSNLYEVADKWTDRYAVDFSALINTGTSRFIPLPKYVFDHGQIFHPEQIQQQQILTDTSPDPDEQRVRQVLEQLSKGQLSREAAMQLIQV